MTRIKPFWPRPKTISPMKTLLKPFPVLIACEGCPAAGQAAREVVRALDRRGLGEAAWLGAPGDRVSLQTKARARFPVYCVDACQQACARSWLAVLGAPAQRCFVLEEEERSNIEQATDRIAADI